MSPSFTRRMRGALATLSALLCLPALAFAQGAAVEKRWAPTPSMSLDGWRVDDLFWMITWLISASFFIVLVLLIVPVLRDRARPGHKAHYDSGTSLHDKRFTVVVSVTVFLVLDASVLYISMRDLREANWNIPKGPECYRVEVLGQQWAWNFRATGEDGEFGTADDIVTINHLHVPDGRPVVFNLTSKDVIHSLFLPDMRVKRDANPGAINQLWFQPQVFETSDGKPKANPPASGEFDILCAELCGFAHYQMHGVLTVVPDAEGDDTWEAWEREASRIARETYDAKDAEAQWAWAWKE
ncbi:MAG: hypothetical protein ACT4PU_08850 [Planctomycetota bacterium]